MRFSAEEAFEAAADGDPIIIDEGFAKQIVQEHDADWNEFAADHYNDLRVGFYADKLMQWLGY